MKWFTKIFKTETEHEKCIRILDETAFMLNRIEVNLRNNEKQNEILFANLKGTMPELPSVYRNAFKEKI